MISARTKASYALAASLTAVRSDEVTNSRRNVSPADRPSGTNSHPAGTFSAVTGCFGVVSAIVIVAERADAAARAPMPVLVVRLGSLSARLLAGIWTVTVSSVLSPSALATVNVIVAVRAPAPVNVSSSAA